MAVFLSILFLASASFAQSILIGKKYTGFECKKILKKMVPIYQINIKDRNIIFYGELEKYNSYYDEKLLVIYDSCNRLICAEGIYLTDRDNLFSLDVTKESCAFKLRDLSDREATPVHKIYYINSNEKNISRITIKDYWVASLVIVDNYIIYSTDFDNATIRKIDINSKDITSYVGFFPSVELYHCQEDSSLACFEYDGLWYNINADSIHESSKNMKDFINLHEKKDLHDFEIINYD